MRAWESIGRIAYIVLLPAIFLYAAVSRPRTRMLVIVDKELLVVKNWLGAGNWSLPGGGAHKGEAPLMAAVREVKEELGIDLVASEITELGQHVSIESRLLKSKYYLFSVVLAQKPQLTLQQTEIMGAKWLNTREIDKNDRLAATVKDSLQVWLKS